MRRSTVSLLCIVFAMFAPGTLRANTRISQISQLKVLRSKEICL
jgi:hypothetical protein